jgi:hypothetical protein
MTFTPVTAALLALATKSLLAPDYNDHVRQVLDKNPAKADLIHHVDLLAVDYVIHYEQAVILGTTADYEEQTKIHHFNAILAGAEKSCENIDLAHCVRKMICKKEIIHNLKLSIMNCDI